MNEEYFDLYIEQKKTRRRNVRRSRFDNEAEGFKCVHCHNYVLSDPLLSGVRNRNHCPYCLCSRHLDHQRAGDRLSACKAKMKPIGLSVKQVVKKYGSPNSGELMVIHQCTQCGKVSINRIAADDDAETVLKTFNLSARLELDLVLQLSEDGITVLTEKDKKLVNSRIYGL